MSIPSKPVRINAEYHAKLTAIADESDMTLTKLMDRAIIYFLKHRDKAMKKPLRPMKATGLSEANK